MNTIIRFRKYVLFALLVCCLPITSQYFKLQAQTQAQIQKAEAALQTMTPAQIDARIKELGMTREQAEAKAKEFGINLESYLIKSGTPAVVQPSPTIKIDVAPQAADAAVPQTGTGAAPGVPMQTTTPAGSTEQPVKIIPVKVEEPKPAPGEIENFGYSIFKSSSMFEARPSIDNDYRIGVGDVLKIALWGEMQSYNEYTVDGEGRILVSAVGPIMVSGLTLDKARRNVQNAMSSAFGGLTKSPPTIFMDLTVARIRPVRVFMMGEVNSPGGFEVSGFANVFNSMFAVGGPKLSGSMRDIHVIRSGKTMAHVDLYDYLIGSSKTSDMRINDNDIIYIPLRGKMVAIKGAVLRSANFEMLPDENLKQLIEFSGGIRTTFYLQRIQVDRIVPFAERRKGEPDRKVFDIDFSELLRSGKDYKLEDGDIITIFPILEEKKNYVNLDGAVWRPGRFQLDNISTVKDLIRAADGLLPEAYLDRANLVRTYEDKHTEEFFINIGQVLNGDPSQNMILQPRDNIRIFSRFEILTGPQNVIVEGMAKHPGTYPLHENLSLYDIVKDNVGLSDTLFRKQVYLPRADLVRFNEDHYTTRIVTFNLWDLFEYRSGDTLLLPGDRIIIHPLSAIEFMDRYVDINGKVKSPGRYKLSENMTLFDLLMQAGGYTEDAWAVQAEISRLERTGIGKDSLARTIFARIPDLFDISKIDSKSIEGYREASLHLQHRDQVNIRPNPNYIFQQSVTIEGEVEHPGSYVLSKLNEHLSDIVKRAGGVKKAGYAEGGRVIRGESRLRINVAEAIDDPEGNNDIILKPGDVISIPKQPFSVQVVGEVNNPGLFSYIDGKSTSFYIKASGGETDSADFVLVTYPTGMVEKIGLHWWSSNPKIPDGSTIAVVKVKPEPPELPDTTGNKTTAFDVIKDTLAIVVSAVTVIVLAAKL